MIRVEPDAVVDGQAATLPPSIFDYNVMEIEAAEIARSAARRIRTMHHSQMKMIFETGMELHRVRSALEHGLFQRWVSQEFGWTYRTAHNYICAYSAFADKSETVSLLPARAIYALSAESTPQSVRDEVLTRLDAGDEVKPSEITALIKRSKPVAIAGTSEREVPHLFASRAQDDAQKSHAALVQSQVKALLSLWKKSHADSRREFLDQIGGKK